MPREQVTYLKRLVFSFVYEVTPKPTKLPSYSGGLTKILKYMENHAHD